MLFPEDYDTGPTWLEKALCRLVLFGVGVIVGHEIYLRFLL